MTFIPPAEWQPHRATWVAWPCAADLWQDNLPAAQQAFAEMVRAIALGEKVRVLVPDAKTESEARALLGDHDYVHIPYGDIWLRDIAPIFLSNGQTLAAARFAFNGWGGKYVLPHDDLVAERIAQAAELETFAFDWILEGGALDGDGQGTFLTTRQCLLNPNRKPSGDSKHIEAQLQKALGAKKVLWLGDGLKNDHTDGHVDNIARFVAPATVAIMKPFGEDDPNHQAFAAIREALTGAKDATGRAISLVEIPSPGLIQDEGRAIPASHLNFYVSNASVIVPIYGTASADAAVAAIAELFPTRKTIGVDARALLSGGGAFHCITQQEPMP